MKTIKNLKGIIGIFIFSILLVGLIAWWVEQRNKPRDLLLNQNGNDIVFDGPLTTEELEVTNPEPANIMNPTAVFTTSKGVIEIELFEDLMPVTVGNFIALAESNFYDGIKFHRVITGFMIQGGDPNSRGDDESSYGQGGPPATIQDEFVEGDLLTNTRGTLAMANTGQPNSGGSQFFINLADNSFLDFDKQPLESKHPVFGRIVGGMDVVDIIAKVETKPGDIPAEPVVIESIIIVRN